MKGTKERVAIVGFSVMFVVVMSFFVVNSQNFKSNDAEVSSGNSISGFAVHPVHSSFSSQTQGFNFNNVSNLISVNDTAIYKIGYYSINGSAWKSFSLSGSFYNNNINWLKGSALKTLPSFGVGEHYIIIYSCSYNVSSLSWDCHDNKWQLSTINNSPVDTSCGVCDIGFSCVENVCKFIGPGNLYYVATDGNDSNIGTITKPFATLQQAINVALPGDTVYIRGGVYYADGTISSDPLEGRGASGTASAPIRFLNYPGERPIFDWNNFMPNNSQWNTGISFRNVEYLYLRGFTVRNVRQPKYNPDAIGEKYGTASGIGCTICANIIYENLVVHDVDGRAFQHWTGAWRNIDAQYSIDIGYRTNFMPPVYASDTSKWINCDAYNLFDIYSQTVGNHADGWKVETYYGNEFSWEGCRAWNYSDDGFDPHGQGLRIFDRCWAMSTLNFKKDYAVEGNGFKMTSVIKPVIPDYVLGETHLVFVRNSIAADCAWTGFYNNLGWMDYDHTWPNNGVLYNNLAYRNIIGFSDDDASTFRNNIGYYSQGNSSCGGRYDQAMFRMNYTESNNTWIWNLSDCKSWQYNSQFDVNDDDFANLDTSQLTAPRKDDFSLPDITFGHLSSNSELIDAGMIVPGYHCSTPGNQEGCVAWTGTAPDLGPFEYGLEPLVVCNGPTTRPCISGDGIGQQKRTCIGPGDWSDFGVCEFVGCDDGYLLENNSCVLGPGWSRQLLYNGGFENGLEGWTTSRNNWDTAPYTIYGTPRTPHSGYYIAYVPIDSNDNDYIYQDVDILDYSKFIDENKLVVNASGWMISQRIYAAKNEIKFIFLNESKEIISTPLDTGYVETAEWMEAKLFEEPVPVGTRYIRVWANSQDIYNMLQPSGDLDSFSLKVKILGN